MIATFYGVNDLFEKNFSKLVSKIYASKKRCHIMCRDEEQVALLSKNLWTFSQREFLPHGQGDMEPKYQPIWLSVTQENVNGAKVFVSVNEKVLDIVDTFERLIDFYPLSVKAQNHAKERMQFYKNQGIDVTSWVLNPLMQWEKEST
jgi:DNA polymerase-3 subunit chi